MIKRERPLCTHWDGHDLKKKKKGNKFWEECGEIGTFACCWWGCKRLQLLWKTVWRFLNKLNIEFPCDPAVLPRSLPNITENRCSDRTACTGAHSRVSERAQRWEQPGCPRADVNKTNCVAHPCSGRADTGCPVEELADIMPGGEKADTEGHSLCDSIDRKCPEKANP